MVWPKEEAAEMLDRDELNKLMRALAETREDEIGCDECLERVDLFVEMKLSGLDATEAMPLVQEHLDICGDCREEFEALLAALRTAEGSRVGWRSVFGATSRLWRRMRGGSSR